MSFGAQLKSYRQRRGITQVRLAELSSVTSKTIKNWEHDSYVPRPAQLQLVINQLGLDEAEQWELVQLANQRRSIVNTRREIHRQQTLARMAQERQAAVRTAGPLERLRRFVQELLGGRSVPATS